MASPAKETIDTPSRSRQLATGWPNAYIPAELKLRGWSMRRLSLANGYAPKTLGNVLRRRFRKAEKIIAGVLGIPASTIWPGRYQSSALRTAPSNRRNVA